MALFVPHQYVRLAHNWLNNVSTTQMSAFAGGLEYVDYSRRSRESVTDFLLLSLTRSLVCRLQSYYAVFAAGILATASAFNRVPSVVSRVDFDSAAESCRLAGQNKPNWARARLHDLLL